ncbi:DUF1848 domain-containing protein [Vibrio cholerae]|uniref:DUF1848 domain-containing protein n=1 Tax=Vibrio cholerae TaxID=666 RepID=UPI000B4904FB|nr:DUF1848 domain-containing protein [Vibrio cholerae]
MNRSKQIISVSRKTDIPAFYSQWFIERIKEEVVLTRNPFNYNQVSLIDLSPESVLCFVFWTRNPKPLMKHLDYLDDKGYNYYFQFTITGYRAPLELNNEHPIKSIETFKTLSKRIGKERVIWRYDPIILTSITPVIEHVRLFRKIASELRGYCERVVISFADLDYRKAKNNLNKVDGLAYDDIVNHPDDLLKLLSELSKIAKENSLIIETCAEDIDLNQFSIHHGKCIDDKLISRIFDLDTSSEKDKSQRKACGCVVSRDIGMYETCLHGCQYCYATNNHEKAKENFKNHNRFSAFLLGEDEDFKEKIAIHKQRKNYKKNEIPTQGALFD